MFIYHTPDTASAKSKEMLEHAKASYGMIPNLHAILAEAPATYEAYTWLYGKFTTETSLSPLEQQVVMMRSNFENNCHYCVPAHTWIMKSGDMPEDVIDSLREGRPIKNAKLEALSTFVKDVWDSRGHTGEEKLNNLSLIHI